MLAFPGQADPDYAALARSRLLRMVFTLAIFATAWLVAAPAWAERAPLCDKRAAITFAPPPQIQDPEMSIDIGMSDCDISSIIHGRELDQDRAPYAIDFSTSQHAAPRTGVGLFAVPLDTRLPAPVADAAYLKTPPRAGVERPPRT